MFQQLQHLLQARDQRFVCISAGRVAPAQHKHTAQIDHEVTPPLDAESLSKLRQQLPDLPHLFAFYERFSSVRLFRDSVVSEGLGRASAYYVAPPASWPELRESVEDWLSSLDEDEQAEILPDWIGEYVAIGEIPNSGNYFLVPLSGDDQGKVIEFEHDGFEFIERGVNFEAFIESLADTSPAHLGAIGGHTRYSDGKTSYQWMPERYECDEGA